LRQELRQPPRDPRGVLAKGLVGRGTRSPLVPRWTRPSGWANSWSRPALIWLQEMVVTFIALGAGW